jgi:hypothetical protein
VRQVDQSWAPSPKATANVDRSKEGDKSKDPADVDSKESCLTRPSSATAGGIERGKHAEAFRKIKTAHPTARGWLQRCVRHRLTLRRRKPAVIKLPRLREIGNPQVNVIKKMRGHVMKGEG